MDLKLWWKMIKIMFPSFKSQSFILLILLILINIANEIVGFQVGVIPSKYYFSLTSNDLENFKKLSLVSCFILFLASILGALKSFFMYNLKSEVRKLLTIFYEEIYLNQEYFYQINSILIDNQIDQIIIDDIMNFSDSFCEILISIIISPGIIVYYGYLCFKTSDFFGLVTCAIYVSLFTPLAFFASSIFGKFNEKLKYKEGKLRYLQSVIRKENEKISLSSGNKYYFNLCQKR